MVKTISIVINGRVHGVFFRRSAREKAEEAGIGGWVRNTPQGAVEMMATGEQAALDDFLGWCRRGPEKAVVTTVTWSEAVPEQFDGFAVRH